MVWYHMQHDFIISKTVVLLQVKTKRKLCFCNLDKNLSSQISLDPVCQMRPRPRSTSRLREKDKKNETKTNLEPFIPALHTVPFNRQPPIERCLLQIIHNYNLKFKVLKERYARVIDHFTKLPVNINKSDHFTTLPKISNEKKRLKPNLKPFCSFKKFACQRATVLRSEVRQNTVCRKLSGQTFQLILCLK